MRFSSSSPAVYQFGLPLTVERQRQANNRKVRSNRAPERPALGRELSVADYLPTDGAKPSYAAISGPSLKEQWSEGAQDTTRPSAPALQAILTAPVLSRLAAIPL